MLPRGNVHDSPAVKSILPNYFDALFVFHNQNMHQHVLQSPDCTLIFCRYSLLIKERTDYLVIKFLKIANVVILQFLLFFQVFRPFLYLVGLYGNVE
jgi:hypothetical protein